MPVSVVILAAGQGKRMNSDLPKVLQPLAGRPLLKFAIDAARALSPGAIYVVYGHGGAEVQAAFSGESVDWVLQAQQLGTAHAVMQALPLIPDDDMVLVLYGDVPLIRAATLQKLLATAGHDGLAVLSTLLHDPGGYGRILRDPQGRFVGIVEHRDADAAQIEIREINSGVMAAPAMRLRSWLLEVNRHNAQGEFLLTDIVAIAARAGNRVEALNAADPLEVLGVNDRVQLALVEAHHRRECARQLMLAGATLADPARIDIRGEVTVGRDVYIDVGAVLIGRVTLGNRVKVGPNCVIIDSAIGADTEIRANCVIEHAEVAENCRIGPFARLRPDTVLDHDVHIGNFVETKNAQLGAGAKANHLSYVGDARVGSGANLGAGSITCNYDGANKWPTVIGDGAFIGSGSMLVAPVRIGAGATIGAGSTITASAPEHKLTLERSRQITVDAWVRPQKLGEAEAAARLEAVLGKPKS
jgi:bifunctional UDP-N-acetylglucosamine pyrophosphorylase/glucosamine-1-phosphate N-acetyltransferase